MILKNGRIGIVSEIDPEKCKVKVTFDDLGEFVTDWLFVELAGGFYKMPELKDTVVAWMDEFLDQGIVMGSIYNVNKPGPYSSDSMVGFKIPGIEIIIDKKEETITIKATEIIMEADNITMNTEKLIISGNVELGGDVIAEGNVEAKGTVEGKTDLIAGPLGIKFLTHKHASGSPGSPTGPVLPL